jgi:hypothetical protein
VVELDQAFEDAVAEVSPDEVATVLGGAATLVEQGLPAVKAITKAVDEIAGRGVWSVALHQASLDAVCRAVYGPESRCGLNNQSVSRWERGSDLDRAGVAAVLRGAS